MRVAAALHACPDLSEDETKLLDVLSDPANDGRNLAQICASLPGWSVGKLLRLFARASGAESWVRSMRNVWTAMPAATADLMAHATPTKVECSACAGYGKVSEVGLVIRYEERGAGAEFRCLLCKGTGKVVRPSDPERQRTALSIGGVLRKDSPVTEVNIDQRTLQIGTSTSFRAATDKLLFAGTPPSLPPVQEHPSLVELAREVPALESEEA